LRSGANQGEKLGTTSFCCPSCNEDDIKIFYEQERVPVQSVLLIPTRKEALDFPTGRIALGFCEQCGFIFNTAFDPLLLQYSRGYESTQAYSETFNAFAQGLARRLIERHDLRNKTILEIGCGNGEFLSLLCKMGHNKGIGFDPAYVEDRCEDNKKDRITFIKDYYSERYENYDADFICCKMTLEHIQETGDFLGMLRRTIRKKKETPVFFQVPDVSRILRDCAFEDIYYEHCSYFSPGSLARLFRKWGFEVISLEREYEGQYVMIEARAALRQTAPSLPKERDLKVIKEYVEEFPEKLRAKASKWTRLLEAFSKNGHQVVLWGSGSKAVSFLTTLGVHDKIKYVVDINPHRQGTYMAGTGQEIVVPEFLRKYQPDVVIIMNADLNRVRLSPEILTL
jgi:SAM-dependent methyltransferase